jgi:hypothetical protein
MGKPQASSDYTDFAANALFGNGCMRFRSGCLSCMELISGNDAIALSVAPLEWTRTKRNWLLLIACCFDKVDEQPMNAAVFG